jgi:biopolymer transport protein ExbD
MTQNGNDGGALSAAQRSKIRRLAAPAEAEPGAEAGEINVVPYLDIIMNVMMFVLATVSVAFASTINTNAAHAGPSTEVRKPEPALRLTALVTHDGVALTTAGGAIAKGCNGVGAGITVPKLAGALDHTGLTACARRIKGAHPDLAAETQVTIAASADVAYEDVIAVMDDLRRDADGPLFPDPVLGTVR